MGIEWITHENGICWEESSLLHAAGLKHGVTGRSGGVGSGAYESLNMALHVGDDTDQVLENRRIFCKTAGLDVLKLTTTQQTHEDQIIAVGPNEAGRGATEYEDALPHTDAIMTNCCGIPLVLFIADCVPVILYDPKHNACAVVHDGWRGTVAKLAAKTVFAMRLAYGTMPQDVLAYIGPSISAKHFETGKETAEAFMAMGNAFSSCRIQNNGHTYIDLWAANRIMLEEAGILPERIDVTSSCVYDNKEKFFSYRRDDGITGRMAVFAEL